MVPVRGTKRVEGLDVSDGSVVGDFQVIRWDHQRGRYIRRREDQKCFAIFYEVSSTISPKCHGRGLGIDETITGISGFDNGIVCRTKGACPKTGLVVSNIKRPD